ncbi:MAG: hypothetical protein ABIA74_00810 [bacterium]
MIKIKFIFLFISIIIFNFPVQPWEHEFKWLKEENKNENIIAKIFSVDEIVNLENYSFLIDNIAWMAKELEKQNIRLYLIEVENKIENNISIKIHESFFTQNSLILADYTYEEELIIHPIIGIFLNFLILGILEGIIIGANLYAESSLSVSIATNSIIMLSAIAISAKIQNDIYHKYKNSILYHQLTKLKSNYTSCSINNRKLYIPIFVKDGEHFKNKFEQNMQYHKLLLNDNCLSIS